MERRLPWWFVSAYVLAWFIALLGATVALVLFACYLWLDSPYLHATLTSPAATVVGRLIGVVLEALLVSCVVPRVRLVRWLAFSLLGLVTGTVVGELARIFVLGALVISGTAESFETISALVGLPGTILFGLTLGALQGVVLVRSGYALALWRWSVAGACAWGVYALTRGVTWVLIAGDDPASVNVDLLGFVNFLATFIPGLILGLALKRIVESQPAPVEAV